jgi:hypothetical protein
MVLLLLCAALFDYAAILLLVHCCGQVTLSSSVAHENMVQLLDVFAEGTELIIVVRARASSIACEVIMRCIVF